LKVSINDRFEVLYFYERLPDLTLKPLRIPQPLDQIVEYFVSKYFVFLEERDQFKIYECNNPTEELKSVIKGISLISKKVDEMILSGKEDEAHKELQKVDEFLRNKALEDLKGVATYLNLLYISNL
jgi:hypothetical protein